MVGMLMHMLAMGLLQCTEVLMVATLAMASSMEVIPMANTQATVSNSNMHRVLHILLTPMVRCRQLLSLLQFLNQTRLPPNKFLLRHRQLLKCQSSNL